MEKDFTVYLSSASRTSPEDSFANFYNALVLPLQNMSKYHVRLTQLLIAPALEPSELALICLPSTISPVQYADKFLPILGIASKSHQEISTCRTLCTNTIFGIRVILYNEKLQQLTSLHPNATTIIGLHFSLQD